MMKPRFLMDSLLEAIFLEVATKWFPWQPQFFSVWQALKGEGERGNSAFRISHSHSPLIKACPTG